jgi:hypothetical protein
VIKASRGRYVKVDNDILEQFSHWRWFALPYKSTFRIQGYDPREPEKRLYLARLILNNPPGEVFCVNGDGLDLRRSNLGIRVV